MTGRTLRAVLGKGVSGYESDLVPASQAAPLVDEIKGSLGNLVICGEDWFGAEADLLSCPHG